MRSLAAVLVSTLIPFSLLTLAANSALAADDDAPAPAPVLVPVAPPGAVLVPVQEAPPLKQYVIEFNALATTIGRYSIQGEYLPAAHHAITLNPFYTHASITETVNGTTIDDGSLNGFGGELGYRYYTGVKGPNGFFVGPSVLFGSYSQSGGLALNADGSAAAPSAGSFTSYGGAIDIGGQGVIGPGIVVGGGFGLQWTKTSKAINDDNFNLASAIIAGGGTRPRFLFTIGYAF
ncbi:MAG TPA: hypothetical protein VK745_29645 [Polyangiaceae bacterium]|jgi:hypothetical protein|nr:hypothetical protein [Polyangiaceae bacterium]